MLPSMKHLAAPVLASYLLTTPATARIQITQPAPKADSLELHPSPHLRWVYGSDDPPVVGILIRQVASDVNATDVGLYRSGTPTEWGSLQLEFFGSNLKSGMNVTLAIVDPTEDPEAIVRQPVLDSVGPLLLEEGHTGVIPITSPASGAIGPVNITSYATSTTSGYTTRGTQTLSTNAITTSSNPALTPTSEIETLPRESNIITERPTSASATASTTSDADKLFNATTIYLTALFLLGIPAFVMGINS